MCKYVILKTEVEVMEILMMFYYHTIHVLFFFFKHHHLTLLVDMICIES